MHCNKPIWLDSKKMMVPCQKCRGCRIRRSSEWTMRLQHEQHLHDYRSMFVTLTYSNEYLPFGGTVLPCDLQKFFKRLRAQIKPRKIKHYSCGEYGDKSNRPHYHSIILGLDCGDIEDRQEIVKAWKYCDWENILSSPSGNKAIGMVTPDSIRYVADYIHKKYNNKDPRKVFAKYGLRNQEFQTCSQGIGKDYALQNAEKIKQTGKIYYKGKEVGLPRYYTKKIEIPEEVKERNKLEVQEEIFEEYEFDNFEKTFYSYTWIQPDRYKRSLKQKEQNYIARSGLVKKPY